MRCLVTGASGHLGSFVTRQLLQEGHQVAILVRPTSDLWRINDVVSQVQIIHGELANVGTAIPHIMATSPEVVFHLAWHGVNSEHRDNVDQLTHNLFGSLQLLEVVQQSGCRCWVGVGSQAEYGIYNAALKEDLPLHPVSMYGIAKACAGYLSYQLCQQIGMRYLWFRLLATYGPQEDARHLIPMVILKLLDEKEPALTWGGQQWDYIYIEDAARAILKSTFHSYAQGVFNLASGKVYSVKHIVQTIRDMIDPHLPLGFGRVPYRENQIMYLGADISRLRLAAEWSPQFELGEGLERTIHWYREHKGNFFRAQVAGQ